MFESILCQVTEYDPEVLESLIGLAVEIAREGREGRRVGTLFTLGDEKAVLAKSRPLILDPLLGHPESSRHVTNLNLRGTVKEFSFPRAATSMLWLQKWRCRWDSGAVTLPPPT